MTAWSTAALALPEEEANAGKFFRDGLEQRDAGNKAAAIALMRRAHALQVSPRPGLEAGKMLIERGDLLEARAILREVVRLPEYKETDKTRAFRAEAAALVEQLERRIPSLVLSVRNAPAGASYQVWLDGREFKTALLGAPWQVNPGTHIVELRADAVVVIHEEPSIEESERRPLELDGSKLPVKPAGSAGGIQPPPPVTTSSKGSDISPLRLGSWIGLGVGVVTAGVGTGLLFKAKSDYDNAEGCGGDLGPDTCATQEAANRRDDARKPVDVAGFILGGGLVIAGAATGLLIYSYASGKHDKANVSLVPTFGGALISGSF